MQLPDTMEISGTGITADAELAVRLKALAAGEGVRLECCSESAAGCRKIAESEQQFLVLDVSCPGTGSRRTAAETVAAVRRRHPEVYVLVMLPSDTAESFREELLDAGACDFMSLPLSAAEFRLRLRSMRRTLLGRKTITDRTLNYEAEIRNAIGEIMLREYETLYVLGKASEYKDRETGAHIARVAHYSRLIVRMIGEPDAKQDALFHASALHDIGKIGIPDAILLKPGRLTAAEFDIMKTHSTVGHGMLQDSRSSYLLSGAMIALTHHEKWDGTGYPMNLRGEEIPLYGRIVGIADVFDALTTRRPYKDPWPLRKAFELLASERGKHFDPTLVDAFLSNALAVEEIYYNNRDPLELDVTL